MKRNYFINLTKMKAKKVAFTELIRKKTQGKKCRHLKYGDQLKMADYLQPNLILSLED